VDEHERGSTMSTVTMTETRQAARVALSLKPVAGTNRWCWSLAGEGINCTGTVSARDREDAVVCSIAAAYADLTADGPVDIVVSLPVRARLWALSQELADVFAGVTVRPFTDADAALRVAAIRALEPTAAVAVDEGPRPGLTVATDGSAAHRRIGWGWLAVDGQHGYGSASPSRRSCATHSLAVLAELRGISAAIDGVPGRDLLILTDSRAAITLVREWIAGGDRVPPGYPTTQLGASAMGGLLRIQKQVRRDAHRIDIRWVRGHAGDPLNEGADSLAKLARRHAEGTWGFTAEEIPGRARSIAEAFATERRQHATAA
jgi:ribonuclease HI